MSSQSTTSKTTAGQAPPTGGILVARCSDITTSLNGRQVGDFDQLVVVGMAARLALHLRGVQAVPYDLLKQVGLHLLKIPPTTLPAVVTALAEVDFVKVDRQGKDIRSVVPTVPFYEDLFTDLGKYADGQHLSEPEVLTLAMTDRLSRSPLNKASIYGWGAEKKLVDRMLDVSTRGGFLLERRARGRDIVLSPMYFPENADKLADLTAGSGAGPVARVLSLLSRNQGWPLALAQQTGRIGDTSLTPTDLAVIARLAADSVSPAPSISTTHHGLNYFMFAPKPGVTRLLPTKRYIHETAMALVAAVRQGQLLPAEYAIRSPSALLWSLKTKKWLRANTEALEQYRALATMRLGRLVPTGGSWYRFELIDTPENVEAVDMAIQMVAGGEPPPATDDDIVLALRKGQEYVETLISRQVLVDQTQVELDPETQRNIDDVMLRGAL